MEKKVFWNGLKNWVLPMAAVIFGVAANGIMEGKTMEAAGSRGGKTETKVATLWERAGVSQQAFEDFQAFWSRYETISPDGKFAVPCTVIWLNGAPGAGKGTNAGYIQDIFQVKEPPLVTSDLLASPEFQKIKDSGHLVGDGDVTALVFENLLNCRYADGVIVDGYPRTAVQAECVKLLHDKILEMKQSCDFQVVIFDISETVSIERQLGRGTRATANNERVKRTGQGQMVPLRKTDIDPAAAGVRYRVFLQQTDDALEVLQSHFPCHRINAEGSFENVRSAIYEHFDQ